MAAKTRAKRVRVADKPRIRAALIEAILSGESYTLACETAGTNVGTINEARGRDLELDRQIKEAIDIRGETHMRRRNPLTPASKEAMIDLMREREICVTAACEAIGVSASQLVRARLDDPDFDAAIVAAEVHQTDNVENSLYAQALKGSVKAAEVWLYNKRPESWAPQRILERRIIAQEVEKAKVAAEADSAEEVEEMSHADKLKKVSELASKWAARVPEDAPVLRLVQ